MLAIRHALLPEELPAGERPLSSAPLTVTIKEAREFVASVVPFGHLAGWLAFGTAPRLDGVFLLGCGLALGIICFAALGLAVSSVIKSAESASPITNAIYLPVVMISGIFDPTIGLPHWMSATASALPIKALAGVLEDAYTPARYAFPVADLGVLLAWAVLGGALAVWRFRRQPA